MKVLNTYAYSFPYRVSMAMSMSCDVRPWWKQSWGYYDTMMEMRDLKENDIYKSKEDFPLNCETRRFVVSNFIFLTINLSLTQPPATRRTAFS